MSALAKLKVRESAITGDLQEAIDTLGALSEQFEQISSEYEIAKKRVAELANLVQDAHPLSLEGYKYRVNYSACSVTAKLAVPAKELYKMKYVVKDKNGKDVLNPDGSKKMVGLGLSGFSPSITSCRKFLSEENFKIAFRDEFGSRKLKSVTKYR